MAPKTILLAAAMILTGPALAAQAPVRTADAGATAGTGSAAPAAKPSAKPAVTDAKKYCAQVEPPTGSLIKMNECKTRAEWADEGVDVDDLKKN
jgi:hypothetical protein